MPYFTLYLRSFSGFINFFVLFQCLISVGISFSSYDSVLQLFLRLSCQLITVVMTATITPTMSVSVTAILSPTTAPVEVPAAAADSSNNKIFEVHKLKQKQKKNKNMPVFSYQ